MKNKIFGALGLGLLALGLASCGESSGGNTPSKPSRTFEVPEEFDTETPVTVTFWHTMGDNLQKPLNEAITAFKTFYPNVTIEHQQVGGYNDVRSQIITNIGTKGYPTMAYCYDDHVALYNEAQITVPLNNLQSDSKYGLGGSEVKFKSIAPKADDIIAGFRTSTSTFGDGNVYTMPFLRSTEALFYNKTFFTEHNLTVPTTWDELWATCAKIKEIDPASTPLGYDSDSNLFITLAECYGYDYTTSNGEDAEDHFLFNNEGMRGLLKDLKGYYDKGYFTTQAIYGGYTNTLLTDVSLKSKAYMTVGSTAGATYQVNADGAFETGVAALPHGKNTKTISQGPSLVFFNKTNKQETLAAWLFTQFLLTPTVQAAFALVSGYLPVTTPATQVPAYTEFLAKAAGNKVGIAALTTQQALAQASSYFTSPVFVGSSVARDEVGNLIANIMQKATAGDTLEDQIKKYFDDAIDECVYQSED